MAPLISVPGVGLTCRAVLALIYGGQAGHVVHGVGSVGAIDGGGGPLWAVGVGGAGERGTGVGQAVITLRTHLTVYGGLAGLVSAWGTETGALLLNCPILCNFHALNEYALHISMLHIGDMLKTLLKCVSAKN